MSSAGRIASLRLLPIDAEMEGLVASGAGAFATRYGLRVHDFPFLVSEVIAPCRALVARLARAAPFGAYLAADPATSTVVGTCAFVTGPLERTVEIAYFTFAPFEGRGVATAMARELVALARASGAVDVVVAHTLRVEGASTRILERLGFDRRVAVEHEQDGPVWRHELRLGA